MKHYIWTITNQNQHYTQTIYTHNYIQQPIKLNCQVAVYSSTGKEHCVYLAWSWAMVDMPYILSRAECSVKAAIQYVEGQGRANSTLSHLEICLSGQQLGMLAL